MPFTRRVTVTKEQADRLRAHLEEANEHLESGYDPRVYTSVWIQKAASLLLMLDAKVDTPTGGGLLARTYRSYSEDIDHLRRLEFKGDDEKTKQIGAFRRSVEAFEVVLDSIDIAPNALFVTDEQRTNQYFPLSGKETRRHQVCVLMPFGEPWSDRIWKDHLRPIVEGLPTDPPPTCIRADDLYGHDVLHDIHDMIETSQAILADITARNPNVFYELGIAHELGKKVILLTQSVKDIPFDLQRFRFIIYEDNSDGYKVLRAGLEGALLDAFA